MRAFRGTGRFTRRGPAVWRIDAIPGAVVFTAIAGAVELVLVGAVGALGEAAGVVVIGAVSIAAIVAEVAPAPDAAPTLVTVTALADRAGVMPCEALIRRDVRGGVCSYH